MLSLIFTYYRQPLMLEEQAKIWSAYTLDPEIIVIDDGSPEPAGEQSRSFGYRVLQDIPWHQDGARNLGAHVATGDWLLFLDIDHAISNRELRRLSAMLHELPTDAAFRLQRRLIDDAYPINRAANIWLIRKADFWKVGGYDERLCGQYGTDLEFRPRLRSVLREIELPVTLDVYRDGDIPDASTPGLERKVVTPKVPLGERKVLGFEWRRVW